MTDHPSRDHTARPLLLDELESIRTLLEPDTAEPAADAHRLATTTAASQAPAPTENCPAALLDLDFIFNDGDNRTLSVAIDENLAPLFPRFTLAIPDRPESATDPVDEAHYAPVEALLRRLLPRIEQALREHFQTLDARALADWQARLE